MRLQHSAIFVLCWFLPGDKTVSDYETKQYLKGRRQTMEDTSKKITTDYFNKTAEGYDTSHDGKFVQCMYREILARVPDTKGQRILDLGCGNGNILKTLKERIPAEYYGLDISGKMIEEAGKKLGKAAQLQVEMCIRDRSMCILGIYTSP